MMHHSSLLLSTLIAGLLALGIGGVALSDDDDDDDYRRGWRASADVAPVANEAYRAECGACHMPYQPGLLPGSAWEVVMRPEALAEHYGDIASLGEPLRAELAAYLVDNAADQAKRSRSRAFAVASRAGATSTTTGLPRISETRYFRHEHHEIPQRLVGGNPEVRSFSQCDACHRGADDGVYNEDQVVIPGVGRWDD
ncbi:MAG: hypothetical protein V2I82_15155 [Halieaceae bacterium]|nr:hypothetical protein [Halieaceae bacterium]